MTPTIADNDNKETHYRKMKKTLTVAIPCYNVEWCLEKCLNSFITEPLLDNLEVLVVNDGSTDKTEMIAERYAKKHPSLFTIISKPNGGHGSAINAAIKKAKGKYFKAVDSDDWVATENLPAFLKELSKTEADAIITHYQTEDMENGERKDYMTDDVVHNKLYSLDEYAALGENALNCSTYHGLTYKTLTYRESETELSEGIFYEDHEYATLPFIKVKTIQPLNMFIYQYLVGNENQSVAEHKQISQLGHLEQVIKRLFLCHKENPEISQGARSYIAWKTTELLVSYYVIAMIKNPDRRSGRTIAKRFRDEMKSLETALIRKTDRRYKLVLTMNRLGFTAKRLQNIKRRIPHALVKKWHG